MVRISAPRGQEVLCDLSIEKLITIGKSIGLINNHLYTKEEWCQLIQERFLLIAANARLLDSHAYPDYFDHLTGELLLTPVRTPIGEPSYHNQVSYFRTTRGKYGMLPIDFTRLQQVLKFVNELGLNHPHFANQAGLRPLREQKEGVNESHVLYEGDNDEHDDSDDDNDDDDEEEKNISSAEVMSLCATGTAIAFKRLKEIAELLHLTPLRQYITKSELCQSIAHRLSFLIHNITTIEDVNPDFYNLYFDRYYDPITRQLLLRPFYSITMNRYVNLETFRQLMGKKNPYNNKETIPDCKNCELKIDTAKLDEVLRFIEEHGVEQ